MRSSADEALQQRCRSLTSLANREAHCKNDDVLEGTLDQRLAVTLQRAMLHSAEGQSFPPWLLWNSFYHGGQEDAQELLQRIVDDSGVRTQFEGENHPDLICPNHACKGRTSASGMEKFTCVQVDVQNTNSLQEAMTVFQDQEE